MTRKRDAGEAADAIVVHVAWLGICGIPDDVEIASRGALAWAGGQAGQTGARRGAAIHNTAAHRQTAATVSYVKGLAGERRLCF